MKRLAALLIASLIGGLLVVGASLSRMEDRADRQRLVIRDSSAAETSCGPVVETMVEAADHVAEGPITYSAAPPATGAHRDRWAYYARNFYEVAERPEVEQLVHNLEHGYNILWYDDSVLEDPVLLDQVRALAESYDGARRDPATALIAAPWTPDDGPPFPDGMNFALTHWYADPDDPTRSRADERGYTRYCRTLSREVVADWMETYPLAHSPEGFPGNM